MNKLPEYRQVLRSRTWSRVYRHADYDPIVHYPPKNGWGGVALACSIAVALATVLFLGWSS